MQMRYEVILQGIVGSHAYGLNTETSDVDRLGIYTLPTRDFIGLHEPKESIVKTNPDVTLHEIRKFLRLALKCNPTVMELLWLPEYEIRDPISEVLIHVVRGAVLCKKLVRNAYLGYATQQFNRLENRGDGSFSADTRKRTAKHARHMARLLLQGLTLYRTGQLILKVDDPEWYFDFGDQVAAGDFEQAFNFLYMMEQEFKTATSVLPETNEDSIPAINDILIGIRECSWPQ